MTPEQETILEQLHQQIQAKGYQVASETEINHGRQLKLPDRSIINIYKSGKVTFGGKSTPLRADLENWYRTQQVTILSNIPPGTPDNSSRATRYLVSTSKFDKIREVVASLPAEIIWRKQDDTGHQAYRADIQRDNDRVVVTQYKTETLLVQGRASKLFDEVCELLDAHLVQAKADRATRYLPAQQSQQALAEMSRPDAEQNAWNWLNNQIDKPIFDFLDKHDQDTLIAGSMLLQAAQSLHLAMPDYSPLVMPFARAYEGFLIKLFIHIGWVNATLIQKDSSQIVVGNWLNDLHKHIEDTKRHGHIASDLKTAWEGTRHLMIHSDPTRQTKIATQMEAENEICGVLLRAIKRGYDYFVQNPIGLKPKEDSRKRHSSSKSPEALKPQNQDVITIKGVHEQALIYRLQAEGHVIDYFNDPSTSKFKWRLMTAKWMLFCPIDPGDTLIVRGNSREEFIQWYRSASDTEKIVAPEFQPYIGADEAGKGDYFGPLVVAAVYVDEATVVELRRWGVKDSKSMSDNRIKELAEKIETRCKYNLKVLMPPDYNHQYEQAKNLNRLLANLHAETIQELADRTGCTQVIIDQFAAEEVMEEALGAQAERIQLTQRPRGESDIAVAAASILARARFVEAIGEFRARSNLQIPLGASAPEIVSTGKTILSRWGEAGLRRIAKLNFRTTREIRGEK
jgi:ribonuclease HIII